MTVAGTAELSSATATDATRTDDWNSVIVVSNQGPMLARRYFDSTITYLLATPRLPGEPGAVPTPSLTGGLPGGCGSSPLPTPLFPFTLQSLSCPLWLP